MIPKQTINFVAADGFPFDQDTFDRLQTSLRSIEILGLLGRANKPYIITGCGPVSYTYDVAVFETGTAAISPAAPILNVSQPQVVLFQPTIAMIAIVGVSATVGDFSTGVESATLQGTPVGVQEGYVYLGGNIYPVQSTSTNQSYIYLTSSGEAEQYVGSSGTPTMQTKYLSQYLAFTNSNTSLDPKQQNITWALWSDVSRLPTIEDLQLALNSAITRDSLVYALNGEVAAPNSWIPITTFNSAIWNDVGGSTYQTTSYIVEKGLLGHSFLGRVQLTGAVSAHSSTPSGSSIIFTLPAGARPKKLKWFSVYTEDGTGTVSMYVDNVGNVAIKNGSSYTPGTIIDISGISFYAEQ